MIVFGGGFTGLNALLDGRVDARIVISAVNMNVLNYINATRRAE